MPRSSLAELPPREQAKRCFRQLEILRRRVTKGLTLLFDKVPEATSFTIAVLRVGGAELKRRLRIPATQRKLKQSPLSLNAIRGSGLSKINEEYSDYRRGGFYRLAAG